MVGREEWLCVRHWAPGAGLLASGEPEEEGKGWRTRVSRCRYAGGRFLPKGPSSALLCTHLWRLTFPYAEWCNQELPLSLLSNPPSKEVTGTSEKPLDTVHITATSFLLPVIPGEKQVRQGLWKELVQA